MKSWIRRHLQSVLGIERYLLLFARYKLATFGWTSEGAEFRHFLSLIPDDSVVLDVGANVGFTTVLLAGKVRRGIVHAFEPNPANHAALRRVLSHYRLSNVVTHCVALGAKEGPLKMVTPRVDSALLFGLTHVVREREPAPGVCFTAECRLLDHMTEAWGPEQRIAGIKIDVEDHESEVLEGGRRLLATHRPAILCELWETDNRRHSFDIARDLGYSIYVREGRRLVRFDPSRHRVLNFYLLPEASAVE